MAEVQTGMEKADMRRLLAASKREPVNVAVAQGPDAQFGLLLMDKIKQPKQVEKMLMAAVPAAKNTRWGTAMVDPDDDPKLVTLFLNKPVVGMARRLAKTLKGTGISKVRILLDDQVTEIDSYAEEEGEGEAEGGGPVDAGAGGEPAPDAGRLQRSLAALIPRIHAASAEAKRELLGLASSAAGSLKSGRLADAAGAIAAIEERLGDAGASAGGMADEVSGVGIRVAKGLLLWNGMRSYAAEHLKRLEEAILEEAAGEPDYDEIRANISRIGAGMDGLDDRLTTTLGLLQAEAEPARKQALRDEARRIVSEYQGYVAADPLLNEVDDNGFMPMDVHKKLVATLDAVMKTL